MSKDNRPHRIKWIKYKQPYRPKTKQKCEWVEMIYLKKSLNLANGAYF